MRRSQTVQKTGFETTLTLTAQTRNAAVVALDRGGAPLGTSSTVHI
jgi:hypothetical protein